MSITKFCGSGFDNIGSLSCTKGNPFTDIVALILTVGNFEFSTLVDFASQTKHEDAIREKKMFVLNEVIEYDDNSEEFQYYESPTGNRVPRRFGKYRHLFKFNKGLDIHKALQSFRNGDFRVFTVDSSGNRYGYSPDGVKVQGFSISMFNPEKMMTALQDNTPAWTPVIIDQLDPREWNVKGVFIESSFSVNLLENVASVILKVVSAAADKIVLSVQYDAGVNPDGSKTLIGIGGIAEADFDFTTTAPTAASMVDDGEGNYTFTGAAMVSGSVDLVKPVDATSTGQPIESTGPVEITIA